MTYYRRKGVAIVGTKKGILVVAGRSKEFILPGGGVKGWESRKRATIRELYEETGLKTIKIKYLFRFLGRKWHDDKGKAIRNKIKVFLAKTKGEARPKHEIKYVAFWKPGSKMKLGKGTKEIIERYLKDRLKDRKI